MQQALRLTISGDGHAHHEVIRVSVDDLDADPLDEKLVRAVLPFADFV